LDSTGQRNGLGEDFGQTAPTYDGLGNMTGDGTRTFGYDYSNRLI
jgi:hypothetical protein